MHLISGLEAQYDSLMGIESAVIAMIVLVPMSVTCALVGFMVHRKRSAGRNAEGKEFALLADARAVEYRARTLLADCGEGLALHDALTPSNMKRLGYGKGILTAKIAVVEAIGAERAMEYGEDADVANRRLHLAKHAFVIAEEIAARAKIIAAAQGSTGRPHLREALDGE